ncbi:ZN271 protein, partial [Crypturellus soui]|nr:ZN271 protein [Crypturellus soui]NWJ06325.1 ZN271 protein [Crypturellus undulatus]
PKSGRRSFRRRAEPRSRRRPHGTEKPYKCLECGKGFTRSSNRNAHRRLHRNAGARNSEPVRRRRGRPGERPFSCSECGKAFSYSSAFAKHRRSH